MSEPGARPSRSALSLPLRIYLVTLLPIIATSLIIGALDIFAPAPKDPIPLRFMLLPVGLTLLFLAVATLLFARSLVDPITRLAQTAAAFGTGDLAARTGIERRDELGQLARAFDDMADRTTHLMRAQKALLANISHELRTPLARIRVALDIVEFKVPEETRSHLTGIAQDLVELEKLVGNIMMTARLDLEADRAGLVSLPVHLEPTEARAILDAAIERFQRRVTSHPLEVDIADPLPTIDADRVLLRRVVDNLLDNARKYSKAGSPVGLRARADERGLEVEISDQGVGISPGDLDQIFTPFFRVDQSRSRATGGVGLGLTLCRQIVESHGGEIAIDSSKGQGTRVRFSIPALEQPADAQD